jgi:hypothetical protein
MNKEPENIYNRIAATRQTIAEIDAVGVSRGDYSPDLIRIKVTTGRETQDISVIFGGEEWDGILLEPESASALGNALLEVATSVKNARQD